MIGDLNGVQVLDINEVARLSSYGFRGRAIAAFSAGDLGSRPGLRHDHLLTTGYGKMFDNVEM